MTTSAPIPIPTNKMTDHRPVILVHASANDGRLPVTITVAPIADLDVTGVFVDFRLGHLDPAKVDGSDKRTFPPTRGDAAISALAASEASDLAAEAKEESDSNDDADAASESDEPEGKDPMVSSQIGKPMKLKVGQSESVRAEVAVPTQPTDDQVWFIRGRFATADGKGLSSSWHKV